MKMDVSDFSLYFQDDANMSHKADSKMRHTKFAFAKNRLILARKNAL